MPFTEIEKILNAKNIDTSKNPFEPKDYYIYESKYSTECNTNTVFSLILPINDSTKNAEYIKTGPFNLFEVQQYLIKEVSKFLITIKIVDNCEKKPSKTICASTFKNFSNEYLEKIKNGYVSNPPTMPFQQYVYTDTYFVSKQDMNDKKSLCQRYGDLEKMLNCFQIIVSKIDTTSQKRIYTDDYVRLVKTYKVNNQLREKLERKYDSLKNTYNLKDSSQKLDSTIYISVLWTILATTTLYYIFKKM
jgi:hypothetical protein